MCVGACLACVCCERVAGGLVARRSTWTSSFRCCAREFESPTPSSGTITSLHVRSRPLLMHPSLGPVSGSCWWAGSLCSTPSQGYSYSYIQPHSKPLFVLLLVMLLLLLVVYVYVARLTCWSTFPNIWAACSICSATRSRTFASRHTSPRVCDACVVCVVCLLCAVCVVCVVLCVCVVWLECWID